MKKLSLIMAICILLSSVFVLGVWAADENEGLVYEKTDGGYVITGYEGSDPDIVIPDKYKRKAVIAIAPEAFAENTAIVTVELGANVKEIGMAAFAGCVALQHVSFGAVERIESAAFFGCERLGVVTLPVSIKNLGNDVFTGCKKLSKLSYRGDAEDWLSVEIGPSNEVVEGKLKMADGSSFISDKNGGKIAAGVKWGIGEDGTLSFSGKGSIPDIEYGFAPWQDAVDRITAVTVGEGIDIVGSGAFAGLKNLKKVVLADTVRLIDDYAFLGCTSLEEIELPSNLRRIGNGAFSNCSALKSIVIPDSTTSIGRGTFMGCSALGSVTLSKNLTELEAWCFAECPELKSIDYSHIKKVAKNAFYK